MNLKYNFSRFLFIFVLLFSTFLTIFYKKYFLNYPFQNIEYVEQKKINFLYKIIFFQILLYEELPNKEELINPILQQLTIISEGTLKSPEVVIQSYILYKFLNQSIDFPQLPEESPYNKYKILLKSIYVDQKKDLNPEEILKLPLGKLALYHYYKQTDLEKAKDYYLELLSIFLPYQIIFVFLSVAFFVSIFIGVFLIFRFFSRFSLNFYGSLLRNLEPNKVLALIESASLYLFLYIPLQFFLMNFIMEKLSSNYLLWIQMIYGIIAFLIALIYLKNEIDFSFIKNSIWTDYYNSDAISQIVKNWNLMETSVDEKQNQQNFFEKLEETVKNLKLKPESPLKEILYGFMGFIVIFPLSIMVLIFTMMFTNHSGFDSDPHPIIYYFEDHFWLIFFMAVVFAPVVEEMVFRNWIYGYLRYYFSVFASAFISGLMFAYLHPQGFVAFPYLTFLGMSLAILREFRPGIYAPVITHAFVNFFSLIMFVLMNQFMNL